MDKNKTSKVTILLMVIVASLMWGTSFLSIKIMLRWLEPIQVLTARWTVAAIFFLILVLIGKLRIDVHKPEFKFLVLNAIIEPCLYSVFETYAVDLTSASTSAIFIATIPCVVLLMQVVFFHRKAKPAVLFGILIAFAGVFVCTYFAPGFSLSGRAAGFVALALTILTGALYALTSPRAGAGYNSITVTAMMAFVGCLVFHIENIAMGNEAATFTTLAAHPEALALTVYLGLGCSALCYFIFNRLMVVMDTAVANNIIANSVTAVGVISGVLLLGDPGGWYTAVGLVLTIAGVLLSSKDS